MCKENDFVKLFMVEFGFGVSEVFHLYQHYSMCSSTAKRSTNNQYVCKYIGRINDQSNWSRPFSLVVMTLD